MIEALAKLGEQALDGPGELREDERFLWKTLATLGVVAGQDQVYVNELAMVGPKVKIRASSEGRLVHPNDLVQQSLGQTTSSSTPPK